jgi:hypothetical protein
MGCSQLKWIADAETQPAGGALEFERLSLEYGFGPALTQKGDAVRVKETAG